MSKKPTAAQLKVLQKMNEDVYIRANYYINTLNHATVYDVLNSKRISTITERTFDVLRQKEWICIDHEKTTESNVFYFITEKGKAAANEQNKQE